MHSNIVQTMVQAKNHENLHQWISSYISNKLHSTYYIRINFKIWGDTIRFRTPFLYPTSCWQDHIPSLGLSGPVSKGIPRDHLLPLADNTRRHGVTYNLWVETWRDVIIDEHTIMHLVDKIMYAVCTGTWDDRISTCIMCLCNRITYHLWAKHEPSKEMILLGNGIMYILWQKRHYQHAILHQSNKIHTVCEHWIMTWVDTIRTPFYTYPTRHIWAMGKSTRQHQHSILHQYENMMYFLWEEIHWGLAMYQLISI